MPLVYWCFFWIYNYHARRYRPPISRCFLAAFAGNFHLLLRKNLLHTTTSTSPSTKPFLPTTSEWRKEFAENSKIQEISLYCFVVAVALVACYATWGILNVLFVSAGIDNYVVWRVTVTLIYFNSSLNPILYCWKIRGVRQAAKGTIRQLLGCV